METSNLQFHLAALIKVASFIGSGINGNSLKLIGKILGVEHSVASFIGSGINGNL